MHIELTRAVYVWGRAAELINPTNVPNRAAFFSFLLNPRPGAPCQEIPMHAQSVGRPIGAVSAMNPFNRIYFEADRDNLSNPTCANQLRAFLKECHRHGIAVEFLDGQPKWLSSEQSILAPSELVAEVLAFNAAAADPTEMFDGIHLDIEPHCLGADVWLATPQSPPADIDAKHDPAWLLLTSARQKTDFAKLGIRDGRRYNNHVKRRLLAILIDARRQMAQKRSAMTLSVDLGPDYYYNVGDLWLALNASLPVIEKPSAASGQGLLLDAITIMNYYASTDGFLNGDCEHIGGLHNNLRLLPTPGCNLVFAAETIQPPRAPEECTFWNKGFAALAQTLDAAVAAGYAAERFAGVAVHHYDSFVLLKP